MGAAHLLAISEAECDLWLKGLTYLMEDVKTASYKLHQERWFRKGFYEMEALTGKEGTIGKLLDTGCPKKFRIFMDFSPFFQVWLN